MSLTFAAWPPYLAQCACMRNMTVGACNLSMFEMKHWYVFTDFSSPGDLQSELNAVIGVVQSRSVLLQSLFTVKF